MFTRPRPPSPALKVLYNAAFLHAWFDTHESKSRNTVSHYLQMHLDPEQPRMHPQI